jgi:cobalt-zinc-cadmium efflux system membrane fusion protein
MKRTAIVFVALAPLFTVHCRRQTADQPANVRPPANEVWVTPRQIREAGITTDVVAERPIGIIVVASGRVAFSDARVAHVFSPVNGRVSELRVGLGDFVRRGTPLAVMSSPDVASAVADLEKSDADLVASTRDFEREKELYAVHAAAQRDFEAAESNVRKARAEHDRAAQKCRLLQASGSSAAGEAYLLRAPIDGAVLARNITLGMEVQGQYSGGNAPELFTLGNLDQVWAIADIFESDVPRVRMGAPVTVTVVAYPDRQFTGRIDWISGALDAASRTAKVRCVIDNRNRLLRPEMYANISILTDAHPRLAVRRSAVIRLGDQMVAYVDRGVAPTGGERFQRRIVSIDDTQPGDFVPVLGGLTPGERVVSSGALILSGASS